MRFFTKPPSTHDVLHYCRKALLNGQKLNTYDFYQATGYQRLPARIEYISNDKRKDKWPVERAWIPKRNPITGRITNIKQYWLSPEDIKAIKKAQNPEKS